METQSPFLAPLIEFIGLLAINRWWESEEHIRPVWKLYWNSKSGASLDFNNTRWDLKPDKIYLIAPMTQYVPHCRTNLEHFYIHFHLPREFSSMSQGIWEVDPKHFVYANIRDASMNLLKNYSKRLLFMELINFSLQCLPEQFFEQEHINPLVDLFLWLDKNLDKNCRNNVLAELSGYSEDTLNRYFIKETGLTPQKYVRNRRINRGANLLQMSTHSVEEISEKCGFYDRSHFHRLFKKATNLSPIEYRNMSRRSVIIKI